MIYPRLAGGSSARYAAATLAHLEHFAAEGLRTLVFAAADIPDHVYNVSEMGSLLGYFYIFWSIVEIWSYIEFETCAVVSLAHLVAESLF